MLGQQPKFLFRHGIIPAHGDDSLMIVPDAVNQRHFLFFKGFSACRAVIVGNPHSCFPFHHAVGIGKLPVKAVGEYFGCPALSRPHRPDQDYISLFHTYLGFGRRGLPLHKQEGFLPVSGRKAPPPTISLCFYYTKGRGDL